MCCYSRRFFGLRHSGNLDTTCAISDYIKTLLIFREETWAQLDLLKCLRRKNLPSSLRV